MRAPSIGPSWSIPGDCAARSPIGTGCAGWRPSWSRPDPPRRPGRKAIEEMPSASLPCESRAQLTNSGSSGGRAMAAKKKQAPGERGRGLPNTGRTPIAPRAPATDLRKLSNIFQRPSGASGGCAPSTQGSSCQSPRVQRCWRAVATSYRDGIFLDHLDVRGKAAARVDALE